MVSFFRRKKPPTGPETSPDTDPARRYSVEELAGAFPEPARQAGTDPGQIVPAIVENDAAPASVSEQSVAPTVATTPSVPAAPPATGDNSPAPALKPSV